MLHLQDLLVLLCLFHLTHLASAYGRGVCSKTSRWSDSAYATLEKACKNEVHHFKDFSNHDHEKTIDTCLENLDDLWTRAGADVVCCEGYEKDPDTQTCKPECSEGCVHGVCSALDQCDCAVNFGGLNCTKTCPNGTFGVNCEHDCKLLLDEKTNGNLTACGCHDKDEVTRQCWATCECKRSTLCKAGWVGPTCSKPCPEFTFGRHCSANCTCVQENTSWCDRTNGVCHCKWPYYGPNCEHHCDGILECDDLNCVCEPTLEQKVARLAEQKEASEHRFRVYLSVGSLALVVVLVVLFALVYKLKRRTGKLMNLEKGSARYTARKSDEQPGEQDVQNPIYDVSLNFESGTQQDGKPQQQQERERGSKWFEGKLGSTLSSARSLFNFRTQPTGDESKLTEEKPETVY